MADNLQFDRAEPAAGARASLSCAACKTPLSDTYFVVNGHVVCDRCRLAVEATWDAGSASERFWKALGLGIVATIGCAFVWYLVLIKTHAQWGILAIVVGLAIGGAVQKGSDKRGGWQYQALAMFLTYTAIAVSEIPLGGVPPDNPLAFVAFVYSIPIEDALGSVMSLVITGIALYEAWKLNRRAQLRVSGPHQVSATGTRA